MEKYLWNEEDSDALCEFLEPMLVVDFRKRLSTRCCGNVRGGRGVEDAEDDAVLLGRGADEGAFQRWCSDVLVFLFGLDLRCGSSRRRRS